MDTFLNGRHREHEDVTLNEVFQKFKSVICQMVVAPVWSLFGGLRIAVHQPHILETSQSAVDTVFVGGHRTLTDLFKQGTHLEGITGAFG